MNTDMDQLQHSNKESLGVPIDLEFEHYLYEVYLNDRIENEILRMMECCGEKSTDCITIRPIYALNNI